MVDGLSAVQTHMTNTLNTPIETLEMRFPLRVSHYAVRQDSGGAGLHTGGDGLIREFTFLQPATVTLLTECRASRAKIILMIVNCQPRHVSNWNRVIGFA